MKDLMTFNILPATAVFEGIVDMETFAGLVFQFPVPHCDVNSKRAEGKTPTSGQLSQVCSAFIHECTLNHVAH